VTLPPYLTPNPRYGEAPTPNELRPLTNRWRVTTFVCLAAACGIAAGAVASVLIDKDRSATRSALYPSEVHALGMGLNMSNAELSTFGRDECGAARDAKRDQGAALLRFKGQHVAAVYSSNDQRAIEDFRILFRATGHILCPDVATVINGASRVLL
jgi:hypothetical protein